MALLSVKDIHKSFGGVKAIQGFSLEAEPGEIHGIIGPNGAGKTTIFNAISGVYVPEQGSVTLNGVDITRLEQHKITRLGMGRTFQNIRLFKGLTVEENVMCAFDPQSRYGILGGLLRGPEGAFRFVIGVLGHAQRPADGRCVLIGLQLDGVGVFDQTLHHWVDDSAGPHRVAVLDFSDFLCVINRGLREAVIFLCHSQFPPG